MMNLLCQAGLPLESVEAYIQRVNRIAILQPEQEQALSIRWFEKKDLQAARELVICNLKFVVQVAKKYVGYGLALADLIQEGNIGLMKAVKKFNPYLGVRLISFAVHWIKAEIHEFVIRNWKIVRVATTKAQRKLFFNLRSYKKHLNALNAAEIAELAQTLDVSPEEVREMDIRLNAHDASFNVDVHENEDELGIAPENFLASGEDPAEQVAESADKSVRLKLLQTVLNQLTDRERDILKQRWLQEEKTTLSELAKRHGVSTERIRQLEENILERLKKQAALTQLPAPSAAG